MRPRGSARVLEKRRETALALADAGLKTGEIARRIKVSARSVREWKARYRIWGMHGIKAKPVPGRPQRRKIE